MTSEEIGNLTKQYHQKLGEQKRLCNEFRQLFEITSHLASDLFRLSCPPSEEIVANMPHIPQLLTLEEKMQKYRNLYYEIRHIENQFSSEGLEFLPLPSAEPKPPTAVFDDGA